MSMNESWRTAAEEASWAHYYRRPLGWYVHGRSIFNHLPFILAVRGQHPQALLEVGSGTGSMSIFLSYFVDRVLSVDLSTEIVGRCEDANRRLKGSASFAECDAFSLEEFPQHEFDVAFSQGFFEHFSDEEILRLLQQQARAARRVVFSVPNDMYPRQDFGNERLLSKDWWDEMVRRSGLRLIESKNYAKPLRRRKEMYLAVATSEALSA